MAEEVKISHAKAFFANPISYVAGMIALGSVVFAWGVSSANKTSDVSTIEKNQVEIKADIKSIQNAVSIQNQAWTTFSTSYKADRVKDTVRIVKLTNGVRVLNGALEKHFKNSKLDSEYIQFLKEQLDEKKNNNHW